MKPSTFYFMGKCFSKWAALHNVMAARTLDLFSIRHCTTMSLHTINVDAVVISCEGTSVGTKLI